MIVNNYTNEIRECVECDTSFHSVLSPQLFIRKFDERIPYTQKYLALPYTIIDAHDREQCGDDTTSTFIEDTKHVYTTIVKLDEHINSAPRTWKRTSFGGCQVVEIGEFGIGDVGVHTISIQCVDSMGVGSATKYYKFMIQDPDEEQCVLDLSVDRHFTSSFNYSDSTNPNDSAYLDSAEGNTIRNASTKFEGKSMYAVKKTIIAGYTVDVNMTGSTVESITIGVSDNTSSSDPLDGGYIYRFDVRGWASYINPQTGVPYAATSTKKEKISNDDPGNPYTLTLFYNGVPMSDYLSYDPVDVPSEVRVLAVKNKIALTRLMEAAQAYAGKRRCTLKLPYGLHIVTDFHLLKDDGTIDRQWVDAGDGKYRYTGGSYIQFPDRFTFDMNGSTISVLQVDDIQSAVVAAMGNNFDTIIKNGKIRGNYKYFDKTKVTLNTEWTGVVALWGCEFCYYENCDISNALGYDAGIENDDSFNDRQNHVNYPTHAMPYNSVGYIDYNGEQHVSDTVWHSRDGDVSSVLQSPRLTIRTTDGGPFRGFFQWVPTANPPSYYNSFPACSTCLTKPTEELYVPTEYLPIGTTKKVGYGYAKRLSFRSAGEFVYGDFMCIEKGNGQTRGFYSKLVNRECFVHFYDSKAEFIKTAKVYDVGPVLIPKNAQYLGFSSFGSNDKNVADTNLIQYKAELDRYYGQPFAIGHQVSRCSGFRNCVFHDHRSSLFDNKKAVQCFVDSCYMYSISQERRTFDGGFSTQSQFADIEESAHHCDFFVTDCENIYGNSGFRVFHSNNVCFKDNRGFGITLDKNVYGAHIEGHYGDITNKFGFSAPRKYHTIVNNVIGKYSTYWEFVNQCIADTGRTYISGSTINNLVIGAPDLSNRRVKAFTNQCNVVKVTIKEQ